MKKNKIILSLMIVLVSVVVNAQNLVVYTNDGVETFFEISSIDSIKIISQEDISNVDTDGACKRWHLYDGSNIRAR